MGIRILFVGFGKETPNAESDEYIDKVDIVYNIEQKEYILNKDIPTLYDYHIVFLNNPYRCFHNDAPIDIDHALANIFSAKKDEIKTLVESGHVLFTILAKKYSQSYPTGPYDTTQFDNYEWNPFYLDIVNKSGSEFKIEESIFSKILNNDIFWWDTHLKPRGRLANIIPLATNIPGFPIAVMQEINKGKIIYFPEYKLAFQKQLFRSVIDIIKNKIFNQEELDSSIAPEWLNQSKYKLPNEDSHVKERDKITEELKIANNSRKILFESGNKLSNAVHYVLSLMPLEKVEYLEKDGLHDIMIHDNKIFYIIEVKGKKGYANLGDLRELLDWYMREKSKDEKKNIKGIFILNHYKDKDVDDRGEPFTGESIKMANNNDFLLITTSELFKIFKDYKEDKITKNEILELFNKKGLLNYKNK